MPRHLFMPASVAVLLLAACGGTPPPLDTSNLPPEEKTEDWQDWGPEENLKRRVSGDPMTSAELTQAFVGKTLSGCYANGQAFAEVLHAEGNVLDPQSGAIQARYAVQNDQLCFAYPNQNPACYTVTRFRGGYLFYSAGGFSLVASTLCPIPSDVKGLPSG